MVVRGDPPGPPPLLPILIGFSKYNCLYPLRKFEIHQIAGIYLHPVQACVEATACAFYAPEAVIQDSLGSKDYSLAGSASAGAVSPVGAASPSAGVSTTGASSTSSFTA